MKTRKIESRISRQTLVAGFFHRNYETVPFVAAVLLILLFGYAATSKIAEYKRFVSQMELVPMPIIKYWARTIGWLVPSIEFFIVMLLVREGWRRLGLYASFTLLLIFQIYIASMFLSGLKLPCTCGGLISELRWKEHLVFNAFFMLIAILPIIYRRRHVS
jgi:putative oxidoreductase